MKGPFACLPLPILLAASLAQAQSLTGLRIQAPDQIEEHASDLIRAYATFDDATEYEVTLFADLSVSPGVHATLNEFGLFHATGVDQEEMETVFASFEHNGVQLSESKGIQILDTLPPGGRTLDFDGVEDLVMIPASGSLSYAGGGWTIEAWIRPDNVNPPLATPIVGQISQGVVARDPYSLQLGGGEVSFRIDNSFGSSQKLSYAVNEGAWVHVAGVYDIDRGTVTLLINGEEVVWEPISALMESSEEYPVVMGGQGDGPRFYDGQLDEVRIWRTARSYCEIRGYWQRRIQGSEPGLVGYWRFDVGGSQTVTDAGPFGNDGVLGTTAATESADPAHAISGADLSLIAFPPTAWSTPEYIEEVSSAHDWTVSVSDDGLEMFIGSERDGFAEIDIYRAVRPSLSHAFSTPTVVTELSVPGYENHDNAVEVSADGLRMYFSRIPGSGPGDFFVAERTDSSAPWSEPEPLVSINTAADEEGLSVSGDELFAVFISTQSGSNRFWTCSRQNSTDAWGNFALIDTLAEFSPLNCTLSNDALTVFVTAEGPTGLGGEDVWRLTRPSRNAPFGEPVHVPELSSDRREFDVSLSADGRSMYLVRQRFAPRGDILVSRFEVPGGPVDGELDCDGDVDRDDFGAFAACIVGPLGGVPRGCRGADQDDDEDVDLKDYARFLPLFMD